MTKRTTHCPTNHSLCGNLQFRGIQYHVISILLATDRSNKRDAIGDMIAAHLQRKIYVTVTGNHPMVHTKSTHRICCYAPKRHLQLKNSCWRYTTSLNMLATQLSPNPRSVPCHGLKAYPSRKSLHSSTFEPSSKIFALTDIKGSEFVTAFYNRFNADARDSHAPSNGQLLKLQQVKTYAPK